ncbi:Forkhead box protein D2 [Tulasnella sp. 330]|nr:Forkhead box protein D2 [Tulasnella sp. 330]KAG8877549.1 Forkhead box protein D2 [Tulasnella sp. 331]KAG8884217.1 Forkhead box protein D2 [Tulasnella sp. 332]
MNQGQGQIQHTPLDRPPPTFADLIKWAILRSPRQRATSEEICEAVRANYPFYQDPEEFEFMKAGVRHRTSKLPQFRLTDEKPVGQTTKGNYWIYVAELDKPRSRGRSNTASDVSGSPVPPAIPTLITEGGSGTAASASTHGSASPLEGALAAISLGALSQNDPGNLTARNPGAGNTGVPSGSVEGEEMMQFFDIDRLERDRIGSDSSGAV